MFIIGHRGARTLHPENSLASLQAGHQMGVDMIEFDIRLTKDNVPILVHDRSLMRTHKQLQFIKRNTYDKLSGLFADTPNQIASLEDVLSKLSGKVLLNIELKDKGSAKYVVPIVQKYTRKESDWQLYLFSSFRVSELAAVRTISKNAQLALLERFNPLRFIRINNQLHLTAVGFHRLHVNHLIVSIAKESGLFVYVHTVNRPDAAQRLIGIGVDAIVTDRPDVMIHYFTRAQ